MNRWSPYFLSILRIIAAFVYGVHGTQKLFGFPAPFPVPHLPPLFLAGGMIETFGGLLLLVGLFITIWTGCRGCTRPYINRICRCGPALYLNSNREAF